jgi:hypothetical protein
MTAEEDTALFTGLLVLIGAATAVVLIYQTVLARKEFLANFRPRFRVNKVALEVLSAIFPDAGFSSGQELSASITIVNRGENDATILESRYRIYFGNLLYYQVPYAAPFPRSLPGGKVKIPAGGRLTFEVVDQIANDVATKGSIIRPHREPQGRWHLYVMGEARYSDSTKIVRYLGFCRELMFDEGRFKPVEDPEYEYEE